MKIKRMKEFTIMPEQFQNEYDVYSESGVEDYVENDEMDCTESGFMIGYLSS